MSFYSKQIKQARLQHHILSEPGRSYLSQRSSERISTKTGDSIMNLPKVPAVLELLLLVCSTLYKTSVQILSISSSNHMNR